MIAWSRRRTLIAGVALILAANALALTGVAYNRSGTPDSVVRLTQRELQLPYGWFGARENSGITLTLNWRTPIREMPSAWEPPMRGAPAWLDKAKLAVLGFDVSQAEDTPQGRLHYGHLLPKEVMLVLELDGPAYQRALEQATRRVAREEAAYAGNKEAEYRVQAAKSRLQWEEEQSSRLFVVDAGLDRGALRARYSDRSRYAILRGRIRPVLLNEGKQARLGGDVTALDVKQINVSLGFRQVFEPFFGRERRGPPLPYEVTVAFGKRLEPWIVAASGKTRAE